jgi:hypothetical protein
MVEIKELERFLEYLKKPTDITGPDFNKEENERIRIYQTLAPSFYRDLKNDGLLKFEDYYDVTDEKKLEELDKQSIWVERFTKIESDVSNKLAGKFSGDEQFFILSSIYVFWCEQIKALFLDFIADINASLPVNEREKFRYPTLTPVISILKKYKKKKYADLFSDVNCDLRNAFAHFSFDFDDKSNEIVHSKGRISSVEFLSLLRKMGALFTVLYSQQTKAFRPEFEDIVSKVRKKI